MGDYSLIKNPEQEIRRDNSMELPRLKHKRKTGILMKIVGNYTEDVKNLIDGNDQYIIPAGLTVSNYNSGIKEQKC